jgi:phage protein U
VAVSGSAATQASTGTTAGSIGSSSALAPSNVGGAGSLSLEQLVALALTLLLVPTLRRRLARRR